MLDIGANWRIVYHVAADAVVILAVFQKKTRATRGRVKTPRRGATALRGLDPPGALPAALAVTGATQ